MVWKAQGGFGCNPQAIGNSVLAQCAGDGEDGIRFHRGDFVATFKGDLEALKSE